MFIYRYIAQNIHLFLVYIIHLFQVDTLLHIQYNKHVFDTQIGGFKMLRYKIDILDALKQVGFSSYKIRKDKLIGEAQMQKIRIGEIASKDTLNTICRLLNCQPGDILEYVPDKPDQKPE